MRSCQRPEILTDTTPTNLGQKRFLGGPDRKLQGYHYYDGCDWVTYGNWVETVDDQPLFAYFLATAGTADPVPTRSVETWPTLN